LSHREGRGISKSQASRCCDHCGSARNVEGPACVGGAVHNRESHYWIELATLENTVFALLPTKRIVPTAITRITASMTAYSAMSWPSSASHSLPRKFAYSYLNTADCSSAAKPENYGKPVWVTMSWWRSRNSVWRDSGLLVKLLVEGSSPNWSESLVIGEA
jgi:hypothetical protein